LLNDELLRLHVPEVPVVQAVEPDPTDHEPATATPETGPAPSTTVIVTVAVHALRDAVVDPASPPTHIGSGVVGGLTVTVEVANAVAVSLSATVRVTV
jgi:hypothetical protein